MSRRMVLVVAVLVVIGLAYALPMAMDRFISPWGFPQGGKPPLAGAWSGQVTTPSGVRLPLALEFRRKERTSAKGRRRTARRDRYGRIEGQASVCRADGQVVRYTLSGAPRDRQAKAFTFHAAPVEPAPNGLTLSWVRARWAGGDRIEAENDFFWRQGQSAITGPDYADTTKPGVIVLRRTTSAALTSPCAAS